MNFVFLQGVSIYLFVILLILMFAISIGCLISAIVVYRKNDYLENLLSRERARADGLSKCNFILKLKCGELNSDEK